MERLDFSVENLFGPVTTNLNEWMNRLPNAVITFLVGLIIIRILSWVAGWIISFFRMPRGLKEIIGSLVDALLMVFLIIVTLQALGLNNVALVFSAAVAALGLALGNGSVTLVHDISAGIYLARDTDFSIGDIVKVGDKETQGEIISMDMRRTRIRDNKGAVHSLPNSLIERNEYILITKKRDR